MKKIILVIIVALTLGSCVSTKIDLVNNYPDNYSFNIKNTYNKTWSNLIDYIAENNIKATTIDKQSGLIIFDLYIIDPYITTEKGIETNRTAYVVSPRIKESGFNGQIFLYDLTTKVYIRLYNEDNNTQLKIYLHNLCGLRQGFYLCGKSTGVLEEQIFNYINK